jgi:hypothetical protein
MIEKAFYEGVISCWTSCANRAFSPAFLQLMNSGPMGSSRPILNSIVRLNLSEVMPSAAQPSATSEDNHRRLTETQIFVQGDTMPWKLS